MSEEKKQVRPPSILSQWNNRKQKAKGSAEIKTRLSDDILVLSSGQKRLWFLQQLAPQNPFYQYAHLYTIKGNLNTEFLTKSFQYLIDQHEILRSNFLEVDQSVILNIKKNVRIPCEVIDISGLDKSEQKGKAHSIAKTFVRKIFDLKEDLLVRIILIKFSSTNHQLVLSIHHIIGDRTSLQLMNKEVFDYYKKLKQGQSIELIPQNIQYPDYAIWQNNQELKQQDIDYWTQQLSGELPLLALPLNVHRPKKPSHKGATITRKLSADLSQQIHQLAITLKATPYVLMLSVFKILLYRYCHQSDILVGTPFSNRDKLTFEKLVGFFNETLVIRTQLSDDWTFQQLTTAVKNTTLAALAHKNMPFDELVRRLKPERHDNINPIFQSMFLYNNTAIEYHSNIELDIEDHPLDLGVSKFDLTLFVNEKIGHLEIAIEYAINLFDESTIQTMLQHLENILLTVVKNPEVIIGKTSIMDEVETQMISTDWNKTSWEMPPYHSIHQVIEKVALEYPDQVAVVFEEDQLTYTQLNQRAHLVAQKLLETGAEQHRSIGLFTEPSVDLIVGILGILKAGCAYLPLDPSYPSDRINYMIEDAEVAIILTQDHLKIKLDNQKIKSISIEKIKQEQAQTSIELPIVDIHQMAYLIYTSGSTGLPKGVPISHQNLLHSTLARFSFYPSNPLAFLLLSSFSFDSSIVGIFWTLCSGGKLVLPQKRIEQDITMLANLIQQHQVSHTLLLPSLYSMVLNYAPTSSLQSLQNVMVAGEACPTTLVDKHFQRLPKTDLYNEYGPTEASVWCIAHKITSDDKRFVPIGKAIPNASAFILDQHLRPVPIGVSGELYIGGLGLSKGYLNRPVLTTERFLPHPFISNERIYKTGDLARYHKNGLIEFLGRADQQVKIRGFRVEPEEIQKVILQSELVAEALVVVTKKLADVPQQLVAYLSPASNIELSALKTFLKKQLPDYMVPAILIPLDQFPRLPNGKVNRKKLPDPSEHKIRFHNKETKNQSHLTQQDKYIPPVSPLEIQLVDIWESILNTKPIGIEDNFFAIGGDSILSIQVVAKAKSVGIILSPTQLFEHQSIAALARSIEINKENKSSVKPIAIESINNPDRYPLSYLQNAFLFNNQRSTKDQGQLFLEFTISGRIDFSLFEQAWADSVNRHDAMRAYVQTSINKLPIQVIAPSVELSWEQLDWTSYNSEQQHQKLKELQLSVEKNQLDLSKAPISKMYLIQLEAKKHLLCWLCHHIFLDGWSCGIVLKDAFHFYKKRQENQSQKFIPSPNYLSFLKWQSQQDNESAKNYWVKELMLFDTPLLFKKNLITKNNESIFHDTTLALSEVISSKIRSYCQANQVTISTFFQGIWATLLSHYFNTSDVVYGLTVTGRFADYPNIDTISGLFMNIIPNRFQLQATQNFKTWLNEIQVKQGQKNQFDSYSFEAIKSATQWPHHTEMFHSLFVFGNFLKDRLTIGELTIEDFQGGFSSTYPLTIRINPTDSIKVNWRYDINYVSPEIMDWFQSNFNILCESILQNSKVFNTEYLLNSFNTSIKKVELTKLDNSRKNSLTLKTKNKITPRTSEEIALVKIWEKLFNVQDISIYDNYFELGGNSLMAIQLFGEIERNMNFILPPATLFQHPSIAQLAKLINNQDTALSSSSSLVPLRKTGNKPPLFCLHGGGAHVFFYQALAKNLSQDQPVYSLQPPGLDGISEKHQTIEEMSAHYIEEIKSVQSSGPYFILGTCFSNAVAIEIGNQLIKKGEKIARLFIIDSAPVHLFGNDGNGKNKTITRFFDMLKRGDFSRIKNKVIRRFQPRPTTQLSIPKKESESEKNLRLTINSLNEMYANYHWTPFDGKIHFIRSSEFQNRSDKKYHLIQWNKLAKKGIEVHVVPGHHISLFEEPEVMGLAKKIAACVE